MFSPLVDEKLSVYWANAKKWAKKAGRFLRPFVRENRQTAVFCGVCLLCTFCIVFVDRPLSRALWPDSRYSGFFRTITDLGLGGIWYGVAVLAGLYCFARAGLAASAKVFEKYMHRTKSFVFMFSAIAGSGIVAGLLKLLIHRPRPKIVLAGLEETAASFYAFSSFPSGHSQIIWAAMGALYVIFPRYDFAYLVLAVLISASRIFTYSHYASDVVMGSYIGIMGVVLAKMYFEKKWGSLQIVLERDKRLVL